MEGNGEDCFFKIMIIIVKYVGKSIFFLMMIICYGLCVINVNFGCILIVYYLELIKF